MQISMDQTVPSFAAKTIQRPKFWVDQKTPCEVFAVKKDTEEWKFISLKLQRSLPNAEIEQIKRNHVYPAYVIKYKFTPPPSGNS